LAKKELRILPNPLKNLPKNGTSSFILYSMERYDKGRTSTECAKAAAAAWKEATDSVKKVRSSTFANTYIYIQVLVLFSP
jgi:hypothetical protein